MNRSSKGFGLTGVAVAVVLMFVTAVFSTSAKSAEAPTTLSVLLAQEHSLDDSMPHPREASVSASTPAPWQNSTKGLNAASGGADLPNLLRRARSAGTLRFEVPDFPACNKGVSKHEHELEYVIRWIQGQVCAELASVNRKLDIIMYDAAHNSEPTVQPRFQPVSRDPRCRSPAPASDDSMHHTAVNLPTSQGIDSAPISMAAKLKRVRTKLKFISSIAVAARKGTGDPTTSETFGSKNAISTTSKAQLSTRVMPSMWDREGGARMKEIQKILNSHRSNQGLRMKLWQLTDNPYSSKLAFIYAWTTNILVVSSVLLASFEEQGINHVQSGFEMLFAVEFLLRLTCCPDRFAFVCSFFNWLDLLSLVPLGFRLSASTRNETVLAVVPMIRLFKQLRRFEKLRLMVHAFALALEALPVLLYSLAVIAVVFAEIFYFVEPRSNIPDLPSALWFTMVTMTTVGYGDMTPTTTNGHVAASTLMVVSALYMAMPLGMVGDAFSRVWADRDRLLVMKRFRYAFLAGGFSMDSLQRMFAVFDEDSSGTLNITEFTVMLKTMQMKISEDRINVLFATLDQEGTGEISLQALMNLLAPKALAAQIFQQGALAAQKLEHEAELAMKTLNPLKMMLKPATSNNGDLIPL